MFIGFGIKGHRSFGEIPQYIAPIGRMNIFAGANNSGKSNVLRAVVGLQHLLKSGGGSNDSAAPGATEFRPTAQTTHLGKSVVKRIYLPIPASDTELNEYLSKTYNDSTTRREILGYLAQLIKYLRKDQESHVWFEYDPANPKTPTWPTYDTFVQNGATKILNRNEWLRLFQAFRNMSGGGPNDWVPPVIAALSPFQRTVPQHAYEIPAFRKIGGSDSDINGLGGEGLIKRLAALERPNFERLKDQLDFAAINEFVKEVTDNRSARIQIPSDNSAILVELDEKILPIESLGTGLHEVIILAAAATTVKDSIVCIEEPEVHLHPHLQKRLLRYLLNKTSNKYFITTHSAKLLDFEDASVFHVSAERGETRVTLATTPTTRAAICFDLGYRASDLLQANCVIWVEGPSDRIYLNYWISSLDPALREGLDYSIMFYGGRLLSHLTADDPEVGEFISLRRINRNIAVLIDSDKDNPHSRINGTKQRVREEFDKGPGFAWITKGREIENYIPEAIIEKAILEIHRNARPVKAANEFDVCYKYTVRKQKEIKDADKVKLAKTVCKMAHPMSRLDLSVRVAQLIKFIKQANA